MVCGTWKPSKSTPESSKSMKGIDPGLKVYKSQRIAQRGQSYSRKNVGEEIKHKTEA